MGVLGLAVLLPLVSGLLPVAHTLHPESLLGAGDDLMGRASACFVFGLLSAAPTAALLTLLSRQSGMDILRLALVAGAAGLVGVLALVVHCPITQPIHLLLGHGPVVLGMIALYLLVFWRVRPSA